MCFLNMWKIYVFVIENDKGSLLNILLAFYQSYIEHDFFKNKK